MTDYEQLLEKIENLEYENARLVSELDEIRGAEDRSRQKIEKAYADAESKKNSALYAYALELKSLKAFAYKWREYFDSAVSERKKSEIIDLLSGFLDKIDHTTAKRTVEKISKILPNTQSDSQSEKAEEFEFDLGEAINPSEALDLESLCKELGVFEG